MLLWLDDAPTFTSRGISVKQKFSDAQSVTSVVL